MIDLLKTCRYLWPKMRLYKEQEEIVRSVQENDETYVPAGNELGKDYIAARIVLAFFLTRHPCRIVTTSVKDRHLDLLWGEIGQAINECESPMNVTEGGPLIVNHHHLRKMYRGKECPISFVLGQVASDKTKESFQGQHVAGTDGIPRTLFVGDEASGLPDRYYDMASTWAKRMLFPGNTWPCENFFKRAVKGDPSENDPGGDIPRANGKGFHRKIIHFTADHSPNVRYAKAEERAGKQPSGRILVPGVLSYEDYCKRRRLKPKAWQTVSMDAEWYEGPEEKMYPQEWRLRAMDYADELDRQKARGLRRAEAIGIDAGEGSADTSMYAVDHLGIIDRWSEKTKDTSLIEKYAIEFTRKTGCDVERIHFDRGGGGKQIADYMRRHGYQVQTVAFGEPVSIAKRRGIVRLEERKEHEEDRTTFVSRRCQLYWMVRCAINPLLGNKFGIPREYAELNRQMVPIPLKYDARGRVWLPPKTPRPRLDGKEGSEVTLIDLVGCSPDELEALALAVYGMHAKPSKKVLEFAF